MAPEQPEEQERPSVPPEPDAATPGAPAPVVIPSEVRTSDGRAVRPSDGPAPRYDPFEPYQPYQPYGSAEDGGEVRAAERSAERAADLAATEGFHPLRIRPYVAEPGTESAESTVRPLLVGAGAGDGPATADLGLFSERYAGVEYPQDHDGGPAGHGGDPDAGYDPYDEAAEAAEAEAQAALHGRHRRRRRGIVVAAAAVAASALAAGAVAMTGQVMSDEQGSTGYALPDSAAAPDVTLPAGSEPATATTAAPVTQRAAVAPRTTTPTPSATATPGTTASGSPTASAGGSVTTPDPTATATSSPGSPGTTAPAAGATPADSQVLTLGDTGPAVADLQRRLTEVWVYHGPIDGVFDTEVQQAVATFQVWYWVSDAPDGSHNGVYGPNTRAVLERQTSGAGKHHHGDHNQ